MIDEALKAAITEVLEERGQPPNVAQRLIAWLSRMSEVTLGKDENTQLLRNVLDALVPESEDEN